MTIIGKLSVPATRGDVASLHQYRGSGFPEGRVSAPVGSIYTDTSATNGAIRWIKTTGTSTTGWRVEYGDTGWRNVVPLSTVPASGAWARIRRSGNTVDLSLSAMKFETTGNVTLMTFPVGFRPSNHTPFVTVKYWSSDTAEVGRVNMNGALEMRGLTAANTLSSAVIYTTSDPWPASLPGTPG